MRATEKGAVVVTGASTGIGRACALHLDGRGHRVFAGVRRREDGERLRQEGSPGLTPILLDVTDAGSIDLAAKEVGAALGAEGLQGLVNNAGIVVSCPLEFVPMDDLRRQFEVNVFGAVAVTQAFFPLLRKTRARIVNIGSIGGRNALPFVGPYAATKSALGSISEALRRELRGSGIEVTLIEPGAVATPIWEKSDADALDRLAKLPPEAEARYGPAIAKVRAAANKISAGAVPATEVARAVEAALTSPRPPARTLVGTKAKVQAALRWLLPDRAVDALLAKFLGL
jgi:NAD(P)-dependent dehydrogenase (short-subunit alcohol dehydrogenase family)